MKQLATRLWVASSIAIGCLTPLSPTTAQIVPDNTLPVNSSVTPGCKVCTIEGGTERGVNLFHSFREFSVPTGGEAFFNNATQIETIFSRVTGNSVSNIDGLLRANGTTNLFLLNPNGIIFGAGARLNIGGSFFATTASSFKFADGSEFSATNPTAPPLLTVNVTPGVQWGSNQPKRTIANTGNLTVGQDLTLAAGNLDLQGQLVAGRDLTLQAEDTVKVRDSSTSPFIASSDGKLLVQGNHKIDIFVLNHPNSGLFSGGNMVLRSANTVGGDAHYWSGGSFRIEKLDGSLGDLYSPYDPIIRSLGDVSFFRYQGTSLHILAGGEVNIGTVTITGAEIGAAGVDYLQETMLLSNGSEISINGRLQPTLDIRAGVAPAFIGVPGVMGVNFPRDRFFGQSSLTDAPTSADIIIGDVWIVPLSGLVFITNQYQPNTALPGGDINVTGAGVYGDGIDARGFGGNGSSVILDSRRSIAITDSGIISSSDVGNGGAITVLANETVSVKNSVVSSNTYGAGEGGDINIQARQLLVTDGARVSAITTGEGKGGSLIVNASQAVQIIGSLTDGTSILTAETQGKGDGGNVQITTPWLLVKDAAVVNVSTYGDGNGGSLIVNASQAVQLMSTSTSSVYGQLSNGLFALTDGTGDGGNVQITAPWLLVTDGAAVNVSTFGEGNGGSLIVKDSEVVQLIGTSADGQFPSGLAAQSLGTGDGGNVEITTTRLLITDGAGVSVSTLEQGNGGSLIVNASEEVQLIGTSVDGQSSELVAGTLGTGDGGNVEITTARLLVKDGALVSARTFDEGEGGRLIVNASEEVQLSGTGGLLVNATVGGTAGDLIVNTNEMSVTDSAQATVSSPLGQAGNLNITANSLTLNRGILSAETATSGAEGGANITLSGLEFLRMNNESLISASALGNANGGNVTIDSTLIVATPPTELEGSDIIANAEQGNGGRVNITTQGLFGIEFRPQRTPKNDITASSDFGNPGEVAINTPDVDPSRGLAALPTNVVDPSQQIARSCTPRGERASRFVVTGRGGLPLSPDEPLRGQAIITPEWVTLDAQAQSTANSRQARRDDQMDAASSSPTEIVEADGWVLDSKGNVVLVARSQITSPVSSDTLQSLCHHP